GGDQLGEFKGTVSAINVEEVDGDKYEAESDPVTTTLKFMPSLIVKDFQPLQATCSEPAKRVLGGFAYKIEVEAVGFTPVNFTYIIGGEVKGQRPRVFRNIAKGATDTFGANNEMVFARVPETEPFYLAGFGVKAM